MARILIADDSIIMRRNLKTILEQEGHSVVAEAVNGAQAYIEYEKHLPDMITMDITMPVMNGLESIRKILAKYPDAKIVVISALAEKEMVFEALECGACHYMIKPINSEKVCTTIDEVLTKEPGRRLLPPRDEKERSAVAPGVGKFLVLNDKGTFIIKVVPHICFGGQESALYTAVQGLLYVSPLTVIFDFDGSEVSEGEFGSLMEIMETIRRGGGSVRFKAAAFLYDQRLRAAGYLPA